MKEEKRNKRKELKKKELTKRNERMDKEWGKGQWKNEGSKNEGKKWKDILRDERKEGKVKWMTKETMNKRMNEKSK